MSASIFLNSNENILFLILTIIPICFYFFWKIGYNFRILKIPIFVSIIGAFYFYLTSNNHIFTFENSLEIIFEKLLFLNLLFFSTIFAIIILIIPSNQNISDKTQSRISQEEKKTFTSNLDWNINNDKNSFPSVRNKYRKENLIQDAPKRISERRKHEKPDYGFQKLINDIYKNQNENRNES